MNHKTSVGRQSGITDAPSGHDLRPGPTSNRRLVRSFSVAGAGFRQAWRTQPNLRLEAFIGVLAILLAAWLRAPAAPIALACTLVLALELLNSAVESVVDLASPEYHPVAGAAKDLAAAAVLTAAVGATVVGFIVLGPPLLEALRGLIGQS
jgi:diacylglycerol kinase (ATP)